MKVHPLSDRVLVRYVDLSEMGSGGIVIPDTAKEKPQQGEVTAVGPGRRDENGQRVRPEIKKGDRVLLPMHAGTEFDIDGETFVILREEDILGVLE